MLTYFLLSRESAADMLHVEDSAVPAGWWVYLFVFEGWSALLMIAEGHHFREFGYHLTLGPALLAITAMCCVWGWFALEATGKRLIAAVLGTYTAGAGLAIACFPLNYLRSDMLPVIGWADGRMVRHLDPYGTIHMGARVYDFPYLPGMLVSFWPAAALSLDLRAATLAYLLALAVLVFLIARRERRFEVAATVGVFLLCPFLQYRHDLYLEPHWFALTVAVILMQRRQFAWAALVWGVSCAIYQLSWVICPFVLLNAYRRRGFWEAMKLLVFVIVGGLVVSAPFLGSAMHRIASNTVGQWSRLPHALADPVNLSYWLTYVMRPDQLKWIQAVVLVTLFGICWGRHRCVDLADTLRWMCTALALFIPLNVLVDGYFYLTLLLMLLFYVCAANDWWQHPHQEKEELGGAGMPA